MSKIFDKIHVFRIRNGGNYKQGKVDEAFLQAVAKNYDTKYFSAPITLDHEEKGPSFGKVKEVYAEKENLYVKFDWIKKSLVEKIQSGEYQYISPEFYKDLDGKGPYLRAISFVRFPENKGLEQIEISKDLKEETNSGILRFSEESNTFKDGDFIIFKEEKEDDLISKIKTSVEEVFNKIFPKNTSNQINFTEQTHLDKKVTNQLQDNHFVHTNQTNQKEKKEGMTEDEKKAQEKRDKEFQDLLRFKEDALKREKTNKAKEVTEKLKKLSDAGKVPNAEITKFSDYIMSMNNDNVIKFSDSTEEKPTDFIFKFFEGIPEGTFNSVTKEAKYTEKNAKTKKPNVLKFSENGEVSLDEEAAIQEIMKYAEENKIEFEEAYTEYIKKLEV